MSDDEHTFTMGGSGMHVAKGLNKPTNHSGRIYLAQRVQRLGMKDRLCEIHPTPRSAYEAIVDHADEQPDDRPEWIDGGWGEKIWGWNISSGTTYTITEYVWSGAVDVSE